MPVGTNLMKCKKGRERRALLGLRFFVELPRSGSLS
jgi:hypothetical protein